MEPITLSIGESRPKKWKLFAWLIQLVEGVDHSHIFVSWKDKELGVRKVAEARGAGGRMISNHRFKDQNHVVMIYQYQIQPDKLEELEKWLWEVLGPYGHKHIFGLLLMRVVSGLGFKKQAKNPFKDGTYSQICCELGARAIEKATGFDLPGDVEDYGLQEFQKLNRRYGKKVTQEKLNRINGVKI